MQLPEGGLPKGYEGCTTIKEIAKRKKILESQPSRTSTTSTFTGQSWKPPKTSPTGSRQFSTLRTVWTKSKESKFDEQEPAQDSQPEEWTKLEAEMLEAKRQYDPMRSALKSAQNLESGSQEVTENDVHGARLRLRRAKHAWRMVSDPAYEAQQIAKDTHAAEAAQAAQPPHTTAITAAELAASTNNTSNVEKESLQQDVVANSWDVAVMFPRAAHDQARGVQPLLRQTALSHLTRPALLLFANNAVSKPYAH
ncbi:hypothetical protein KCU61_g7022, partial [Aureobasidium melanogenum]